MKKSLIALAALAATGAFAQSTVTISGRLDAVVRYTAKVAPGNANYSITEDGAANTIRFAVVEDLGGGLRAVGDVGMRFNIATGESQATGRPLFQGETRVGVTGGFGTIKIGRGLSAVQGPSASQSPLPGSPPALPATPLALPQTMQLAARPVSIRVFSTPRPTWAVSTLV